MSREERVRHCPWCGAALAWGETHRHCPDREGCGYVHWDNPIPVVAGIVETRGGIVLVHAHHWTHAGLALVSGFLERGEAPDVAIVREVREEVGADATIRSLVGAYGFAEANQVLMVYHLWADGPFMPGEEIDRIKIVPIDQVRAWDRGTGPALASWLAERLGG